MTGAMKPNDIVWSDDGMNGECPIGTFQIFTVVRGYTLLFTPIKSARPRKNGKLVQGITMRHYGVDIKTIQKRAQMLLGSISYNMQVYSDPVVSMHVFSNTDAVFVH